MKAHDLKIGTIVSDVDHTLIPDGWSDLAGENLEVLAEALQQEIPIILISGSPYDEVYCGIRTDCALQRRVTLALQNFLRPSGHLSALKNLSIHYVSGRGHVTFDEQGREERHPDLTDQDIPKPLQTDLFRALEAGFHSMNRLPLPENGLERWNFESELALIFHQTPVPGDEVAQWAQKLLKKENRDLPADLIWSGGLDYAKASRLRKRDRIQKELEILEKENRLKPGDTVLAIGDSSSDDFLLLANTFKGRPWQYLPIYLGTAAAVNFPDAYVAQDIAGHDNLRAAAFAPIVGSLLQGHWPDLLPKSIDSEG